MKKMKKNVFNWMLMAAVVLGLGVSVSSCKDDDNELTPEEKEQQEAEKASTFWDVVGQLVSGDDVTAEYQGKTFEPTIGIPDETNPTTRIVNTNDMKTAAQRFANLVGVTSIDENTDSYTWENPEIGTMTYTKGGTAAEWATVDVDIKAVPQLQKIIYRGGGEGDNGKFSGRAYYRFGDVVSREVSITYDEKNNNDRRGTITEYWICVRPAFGPEGKEDSHWVCVNTVGDKNYDYYHSDTNGKDYWLPYNLGTNKEHMQNFAEMMWALSAPGQWEKNIKEHHTDGWLWGFDGVPFFTDFKKANIELNNQYFWSDVAKGWERFNIARLALNVDNLGMVAEKINRDGIHLLYKGHSWWQKTSWNCELWEAVYTNGTKDKELNMHHAVYNEKIEHNMKDITLDVRTMGGKTDNYAGFFNNDGKLRWVIRHATGKELATDKKFDVKKPITGVTEVYRYYRDMVPTTERELTLIPEMTINPLNMNYLNRAYYNTGDVLTDPQGNKWFCIQPSGYQSVYDGLDNYAYFISFDQKAVGANLENIPSSKNLAIQMLFDLEVIYHNVQANPTGNYNKTIQNIKTYTGVNLMELLASRDSTVTHARDNEPSREINSFLSTLYRENNQLCIARLIGDYTHDQPDGGREWSWYIWTRYSKKPERKMLLNDLADQNIINSYNEDPWMSRSWYDPTTKQTSYANTGVRTQTEAITPLSRFIYQPGRSAFAGTAPANMYREPLYAFTVKRVRDEGKYNTEFEDGTKFFHTRLMKEIAETYIDDEDVGDLTITAGTYQSYSTGTIYVDEEHYPFGMNNRP